MTVSEKWRSGYTLSEAWLLFAVPEHKEQYRDSGHNQPRSAALESMMQKDLIMGLLHTDFEAIGNLVTSPLNKELEPVPFFIFGEHPVIDWESSSISAGSRRYISVRVLRSQKQVFADAPPRQAQPNKKSGRPPISGLLKEIIQELHDEGKLEGLMRKEQEGLIREVVQRRYPDRFRQGAYPSKPTIMNALFEVLSPQVREK